VVVLAVTAAAGAAWRWRDGRLRAPRAIREVPGQATAARPPAAGGTGGPRLTPQQLGVPLGERATLLQFSSAVCAPCRATRRLLGEVAAGAEGVRHVEIDVDDRMDLVRLLDVRRTPTVFVLGPDGRITRQASGQPRRAEVVAAVSLAQDAGSGRS
jgi:thiol-disulfide isomerase/thioredoxin